MCVCVCVCVCVCDWMREQKSVCARERERANENLLYPRLGFCHVLKKKRGWLRRSSIKPYYFFFPSFFFLYRCVLYKKCLQVHFEFAFKVTRGQSFSHFIGMEMTILNQKTNFHPFLQLNTLCTFSHKNSFMQPIDWLKVQRESRKVSLHI